MSKTELTPQLEKTLELVQAAAALALDKKAEDVVILKVDRVTSFADFFVIASANSERQVAAVASHIEDTMRKGGHKPLGVEGKDTGNWVLLDSGDFVCHLFLDSAREYYDLDGFWTDAERIDVDEAGGLATVKAIETAPRAANG
jgi:ribosome-associated protein